MKFKVGDKVRVKERCSGAVKDTVYVLEYTEFKELRAGEHCTCENNWILVSKSTEVKMDKAKWGVKYDRDEDPIEFFDSRKEAEKRIDELLEDDEVEKDSIWLFVVGDKYKVERPKPDYKLVKK